MVLLPDLVAYNDSLLECGRFHDYCPNGLQVEGDPEVKILVSGVTASLALIEAAHDRGADAVLVHHGYFWKGEDSRITGMKQRRIRALLTAGVSLLAYHLPLDAHPIYGNNVQLAQRLGLSCEGHFSGQGETALGLYGRLSKPESAEAFCARIAKALGREPKHISGDDKRTIQRVAWCTGAAQGYFEAATRLGVDAYISGEISEPTIHIAREYGVHYFAAGHHATERYGVQALGEHLADRFDLQHHYIEIENPV